MTDRLTMHGREQDVRTLLSALGVREAPRHGYPVGALFGMEVFFEDATTMGDSRTRTAPRSASEC